MNTYQIIFLCVAAAMLSAYLIDRFTGHKIIMAIVQWRPVLVASTALCNAIASVLPSSQFVTVATVLRAASDATQEAERLYIMSALPKDERNAYAKAVISETLNTAGVEITAQIEQIIDGCIAVVCMLMPHGVEPAVPEGDLALA